MPNEIVPLQQKHSAFKTKPCNKNVLVYIRKEMGGGEEGQGETGRDRTGRDRAGRKK
jgi:hypothetical protein